MRSYMKKFILACLLVSSMVDARLPEFKKESQGEGSHCGIRQDDTVICTTEASDDVWEPVGPQRDVEADHGRHCALSMDGLITCKQRIVPEGTYTQFLGLSGDQVCAARSNENGSTTRVCF
jgi:hypothetical protein